MSAESIEYAPEVQKSTDRVASFMLILTALVVSGLIVFFTVTQIRRHQLVEKIEHTYSVQIIQGVRSDGIKDNKFMIESWGQHKQCEVPTDFRNPLRCTVLTTQTQDVEIAPHADSIGPKQELNVAYEPRS